MYGDLWRLRFCIVIYREYYGITMGLLSDLSGFIGFMRIYTVITIGSRHHDLEKRSTDVMGLLWDLW